MSAPAEQDLGDRQGVLLLESPQSDGLAGQNPSISSEVPVSHPLSTIVTMSHEIQPVHAATTATQDATSSAGPSVSTSTLVQAINIDPLAHVTVSVPAVPSHLGDVTGTISLQMSQPATYPPPTSTAPSEPTPVQGANAEQTPTAAPFLFFSSAPPSTFNGVFTPLMRFLVRGMRFVFFKAFGTGLAISTQHALVDFLFLLDSVSPIAWGKLTTWYFHPGRYVTRRHQSLVWRIYIRLMFLITNFATVSAQYSGLLFTPAESFRNSFLADVMSDAITDSVKYSGFTNHIIQTLLLNRPQGEFGRALVKGSRLYMEDVLFGACLCAPFIVLIVEGGRWIKLAYTVYMVFLWLDFILKRFRPKNFVRRKISALANEVQTNTQPSPGSALRPIPSADMGFPLPEKQAAEATFYTLFFFTNAVLRTKVYIPLVNVVVAKLAAIR